MSIVSMFGAIMGSADAATMAVNNLGTGPGDVLYTNSANVPMSGGVVTMGYFSAGIAPTTIAQLQAALGSYTLVTSAIPGDVSAVLGENVAGYASQLLNTTVLGGQVTGANELLGRPIYSIVADNANLQAATQFALVRIGTFADDVPFENQYFSNPAGGTVIIGTTGSIDVQNNPPTGNGTYVTLQMTAVPEPSAALLGALGALGLLRRRRN